MMTEETLNEIIDGDGRKYQQPYFANGHQNEATKRSGAMKLVAFIRETSFLDRKMDLFK